MQEVLPIPHATIRAVHHHAEKSVRCKLGIRTTMSFFATRELTCIYHVLAAGVLD